MRLITFLTAFLLLLSCATEKPNVSPLTGTLLKDSDKIKFDTLKNGFNINIRKNTSASEISNLISTFPKFKNTKLNDEVSLLKYGLQNYLYALDSDNVDGKKKSIQKVEKSYKNIQKLRKSLSIEEDELINRYLVQIKTNISVIEDSIKNNKNQN